MDALGGQLDGCADPNRLRRFNADAGFGDIETPGERETRLALVLPRNSNGTDVGDAPLAADVFSSGHYVILIGEKGSGVRQSTPLPAVTAR